MRKLVLAAVFSAAMTVPAAGSVVVIGGSPGVGCYQAARDRDDSSTALRRCDEALSGGLMTPRDIVATHVNRGIIKVLRQEYQAGIADFDRAIALDPGEPESYLNKGATLLRMGAPPSQAIPLFDEALARNTRRPELAYFSRAIANEDAGNMRAAYEDYRSAQRVAPDWKEPGEELKRFQVVKAGAKARG